MKSPKERLTPQRLRDLLKKQRDILLKLSETLEKHQLDGNSLIILPWVAEEIEDQANALMDLGDLIARARLSSLSHEERLRAPLCLPAR